MLIFCLVMVRDERLTLMRPLCRDVGLHQLAQSDSEDGPKNLMSGPEFCTRFEAGFSYDTGDLISWFHESDVRVAFGCKQSCDGFLSLPTATCMLSVLVSFLWASGDQIMVSVTASSSSA